MRARRHSHPGHVAAAIASALACVLAAGVAGAQLPNASPAATGLSGAYTARARGYDAVAWNPANLGLPGNPGFSFSALALSGSSGLDPISLNDVAPYSGKVLPAAERQQWLETVTAKGGENGSIDGGVTILGLSAGPFAVQIATSVGGSTALNPDAFQAVMFGSAGLTGAPANLDFQGSKARVGVFTSGALSFGHAFWSNRSGDHFSIGVTGKYIVGNFLGMAQDDGSATTASSVSVDMPDVYSPRSSNFMIGSGEGMDAGLAWTSRRLSLGATVQNIVNTFAWDSTKLLSQPGTALFNGSTNASNFADQPYADAPASLRASVANDKFKPAIAAGLAYALRPSVTLSIDGRQQASDGILFGPKTQIGGGIELRGLPVLRLRGGASYVTNGWGVSGGAGLALGGYELGVGAALLTVNGGKEPAITLNVLSIK